MHNCPTRKNDLTMFLPNNWSQIPFENVYGIIHEEWHFFQTQTSNYTLSDDTNIKQNILYSIAPRNSYKMLPNNVYCCSIRNSVHVVYQKLWMKHLKLCANWQGLNRNSRGWVIPRMKNKKVRKGHRNKI